LRFVRANSVATCLLFIGVVTAVFLAFPEIDLWFSGIFHRTNGGFWLRRNDILSFFRATNDALVAIAVMALIASVAVKLARPERPSPVAPNVVVWLLSSLILGPLLLVNLILKDHWGRPRPVMVDLFGGDAPYVEVWRLTDWCDRNCSFVSGETSSSVWLVAVAFALPRALRTPAVVIAINYAVLISLNRIAFGGHFLSDVLISSGLTVTVILVLHRLVIERPSRWLSNQALEAGLARLGRFLRRGTA
jgi:membrane-associated PAP2 superfamily phosphatase